ncbi:autotransporter outer membrane beta-barrel domain-containing protein [Pseudomonas mangiferae]|uniref:autotransporter outer membrane beta-barrel domain-containing protein n=1 Tax=Pseudomonas mangiferae TaxID=2593654 RepID=UPI001E3FE9F8|nr:autotransporter domain-containing protein [Pseudomonas mangiferae]
MLKPLATAIGLGLGLGGALLPVAASAYEYGEHAGVTLDRLIHDYPGRYRGTANFAGAADLMQAQMGSGYAFARQDFTWTATNGESRGSQNVVAYAPGTTDKFVVLGAHFDTYFGRPTLQGLDDNGSGAAVLTEIARNLSGLKLENGLSVVGFGAEEEGLRGSRGYVASLTEQQRANLLGMINLDSLITGDRMYAHAGQNSVDDPALASLREHTFSLARELGIDLHTNPGLNEEYPAGTGCCSDGSSFEDLKVPVLFVEATNWELGELDGYEQTDNPAIPGGATWHDPDKDNEAVFVNAFGQARIDQRLRDFSLLLTRLVLEMTNADLLASTASGGALARDLQDNLKRQHEALTRLHDRRWLTLQDAARDAGSFDGEIGVDGEYAPDNGFDTEASPEARRYGLHALGDYALGNGLVVGGSLSYLNGRDRLEHGGKVDSDTWQAGLYALLSDGPQWLAGEASVGHTGFDTRRSLQLRANGGPVLLDQRFDGDTEAFTWGARVQGGYDFDVGALKTGPFAGLDYSHYRIDGFHEDERRRTALGYEEQRFDSLEASLGWRLRGTVPLGGMSLQPYGSLRWVKELGDGRLEEMDLTSRADGRARVADMGRVDENFGRAQLGALLAITPQLGVYVEANSRFAHDEGSQASYSLGAQYQF